MVPRCTTTTALLYPAATAVPTVNEPGRRRHVVEERGLYWNVAPYNTSVDPSTVRRIHVAFSNHLDVGFNVRAWCDNGAYNGCISPLHPDKSTGKPCRPWAYWVIQENIDTFIPRAMAISEALRNTTTPFTYMTQPFVVDFLLDCEASGLDDWRPPHKGAPLLKCPNASAIAAFKAAVARRDIWWHAFPHNAMPGLYDASLFNASLRMGARQAKALGVRAPTTFSQRDETGMTRAIVPMLAAANISAISLGSGGSSGGHPVIPDLFVWRDQASATEVLFVHDHGYGGGMHVLPNGEALYCAWNTDNGGPMSAETVAHIYTQLRKSYPKAEVLASNFDNFVDAAAGVRDQLPVVTQEIGDTWNYGVPSDPLKNAHFREISRLRRACIDSGDCDPESLTMQRFDRLLTKIPEHTWGEDTTWYLGDNYNWSNAQVHSALAQHLPNYEMTVQSWLEQRSYLVNAVKVLATEEVGDGNASYRALAARIDKALLGLIPAELTPEKLASKGYVRLAGKDATALQAARFRCGGSLNLRFGPAGGLFTTTLSTTPGSSTSTGDAASAFSSSSSSSSSSWGNSGPLGEYVYQTLSPADFTAFDNDYGNGGCKPTSEDPGCHNFNKPNMTSAHPVHLEVRPMLKAIWYRSANSRRRYSNGKERDGAGEAVEAEREDGTSSSIEACDFAVETSMPDDNANGRPHTDYGAPSRVWIETMVVENPGDAGGGYDLNITLQWFEKTPTRLAEASWFRFQPENNNSAADDAVTTAPAPAAAAAAAAAATSGKWHLQGFRTGLFNKTGDAGIDPTNVVAHGATHLHSLGPFGQSVFTRADGHSLTVKSLDAPIVSAGILSPFPTPGDNSSLPASMASGIMYNIQNNIWNTNFPQWYPFTPTDSASQARFQLNLR